MSTVEEALIHANELYSRGRVGDAVDAYRALLKADPTHSAAANNLGIIEAAQGNFVAAAELFCIALQNAETPSHYFNLAQALAEIGQLSLAIEACEHAIRLEAGVLKYHLLLADLYLLNGDYPRGWRELAHRLDAPEAVRCPGQMWDGLPLRSRTILLYAEQGYGDAIQFARYVPLVVAAGGNVILRCHRSATRLLATCSPDVRMSAHDDPLPQFDVHCPLMSLPNVFGTTVESIPNRVPYLSAEPDLIQAWARKLPIGFRIGIAWQGEPRYVRDCIRSIPLAVFAPLADAANVQIVSLQKGYGAEQIAGCGFPITALPGLDESAAFVDTAAVMMNLDLVITSDTSIAHLAGALGRPCWIALSAAPDWRWLVDRSDSPWYPSVRLFRQTTRGDWPPVFSRIADETGRLASRIRRL